MSKTVGNRVATWLKAIALFLTASAVGPIILVIAMCIFIKALTFRSAFDAVIFDKATNKPIEGAYVVSSWPTKKGFWVGVSAGHVQFQEARTNADGGLHIDAWGPKFFLDPSLVTETPYLVVMKQGYQVLIIAGSSLNEINRFYGGGGGDRSRPTIRFDLDPLKDSALDQTNLSAALSLMFAPSDRQVCTEQALKNFRQYLVAEQLHPDVWFKDCINFR